MRRQKSLSSWIPTIVAALVLCAIGAFSSSSYAQVKPGDFITPENASQVRDLVGPGVYYKVEHGMTMKIVPTERVDWPPPYKDATEKYSVAGPPLPRPQKHRRLCRGTAVPIDRRERSRRRRENRVEQRIPPDHHGRLRFRFYDCDSEYQKRGAQTGQIEYFQIGHYAGYDLVGRTEVEPLPTDPDFKTTGRYWLFGLYPFLRRRKFAEPASSAGATPIRRSG